MKPMDKEILKESLCHRLENKIVEISQGNTQEELKPVLKHLVDVATYNTVYTEVGRYRKMKDEIAKQKIIACSKGETKVVRLMERFENYIKRIERQAAENDLLN